MNDKFSKTNFEKVSQEVLDYQLAALYPMQANSEHRRNALIFLNHDRNFSTFLSIRYLMQLERVAVADIYALSRAMFEGVVSMGLLVAATVPDDLERYESYRFVEAYKYHSHLEKLGLGRLSGLSLAGLVTIGRELRVEE